MNDNSNSRRNNVSVNTVAVSGSEHVSAQSETYVETSQYKELTLPRFTDSSQQLAVHFLRELDEYFSLRKMPDELRLPLVFRSISEPFAEQWMLTAYRQLIPYDDFKRAFTELFLDSTRQSEIRCRVYQDRYDYRSGESFSERYIRYANMVSMLSPAMPDRDALGAMVTHYEPRIMTCLINANVESTQKALAVLTKLQSPEKWKEQNRTTRRNFKYQDQTRKTPRGPPIDSARNRRPNGSVQVRHVWRDNKDINPRVNPLGDSRINKGRRNFLAVSGDLIIIPIHD